MNKSIGEHTGIILTNISENKDDINIRPKVADDPTAFISKWNTALTSAGSSASNQIVLPLEASGTYNFNINWGDGTENAITLYNQAEVTHTYSVVGNYTLNITGTIIGWRFNNGGDRLKITEISQWGCFQLGNSDSYFKGCGTLVLTTTDALNTTGTTTMYEAFCYCTSLGTTGNFDSWDMSNITSLANMFVSAQNFNAPIGNWNTSKVTTTSTMFYECFVFNQSIANWDTSNMISLSAMFWNCFLFNQPIGVWNTSKVTDMSSMFWGARSFNHPIGNWDVSQVTTMGTMFQYAKAFNQPIGNWNVSKVTTFFYMFEGSDGQFNQPLGSWNVSSVTNMQAMLDGTSLSIQNYDNTLIGWSQQNLKSGVVFGASTAKYTASAARNYIISSYSWTITDAGYIAPAAPQTAFLSTWDTSKTSSGSSDVNQIRLPLEATGSYAFSVEWGDGTSDYITAYNKPTINHTYAIAGIYTVNITYTISGWRFNDGGDKLKLLEISQWGSLNLGDSGSYFYGCSNLNHTAVDTLNTTGTTIMTYAFRDCINLGNIGNMNNWDMTNITYMDSMFYNTTTFNQPITDWDVSNVTTFLSMFDLALNFNQPIGNWNISKAYTMSHMFSNAYTFNQPIGTWNVSSVTIFSYMFMKAINFNQSIENWNVSNAINMEWMFREAYSFNQPIGTWNVSKVGSMANMFDGAYAFNQPIGTWDVSSVLYMNFMFSNTKEFNQSLEMWNVSKVTTMQSMFSNSTAFNLPIGSWNVSSVTNMMYMFYKASSFNQPIGTWDVSKVQGMGYMFREAPVFNQPLNNWNTSKLLDSSYMFYNATSFDQPLDNWNVGSVTTMQNMFQYANSFNGTIGTWNTSKVTTMLYMFWGAAAFNQSIENWNVSKVQNMNRMFYGAIAFNQPIGSWDTSTVTNMNGMFYNASVFNQPIGNWSLVKCSNIQAIFQNAFAFNQSINSWDLSNIMDTSLMFNNATNFNQPLDNWNVSKVYTMWSMFNGASSFNQPIGNWNTSKVTNMNNMFYGASSFNQPIGNWNTSKVTTMNNTFSGASAFNQSIEDWNVSLVVTMLGMFQNATSFNHPLGNWNVSKVTSMANMFSGATAFNQSIANWNVSSVTTMQDIFFNNSISTANYEEILINWSQLSLKMNVIFNAGNSIYNLGLAANARRYIISTFNWNITDGGCFIPEPPEVNEISPNPSSTGLINITWAFMYGVSNYSIYRSSQYITVLNGSSILINTTTTTNLIDVNLVNGTFYYVVVAKNLNGDSNISNCVNVTITDQLQNEFPPDAPEIEEIYPIESSTGIIFLNWSISLNADTYHLYRSQQMITNISDLIPLTTTSNTNYTDNIITNGTYWYVIVAGNASGWSNLSNVVNVTVGIPSLLDISITILNPTKDQIYRNAFGIDLIFKTSLNITFSHFWYQLNDGDWIEIEGNTTINLMKIGIQRVSVRGSTVAGQNITSPMVQFYLYLDPPVDKSIEITGTTFSTEFYPGRTIIVLITIENIGNESFESIIIQFDKNSTNWHINSDLIKFFEDGLAPGESEVFSIEITILSEFNELELTGNLIADEIYLNFSIPVAPNENEATSYPPYAWIITLAIGGIVLIGVLSKINLKGQIKKDDEPQLNFNP